jgi:hypothetical protein
VEELTSGRAEFYPVGDALIHCLPVGVKRRPGQSPMQYLDRLAQAAGVQPLSEFIGAETDTYFGEGKATATEDGRTDLRWFTAPEGLVTIQGLLDFLTTHTEVVADVNRVISELRQFESTLRDLRQKGIRWHLEDGTWW